MKKNILLSIVLTGLLLLSCSKDDPAYFPEIPGENQQEVPQEPPVEEPPVYVPLASKFELDDTEYPTPFGYLALSPERSFIFLMEEDYVGDIFDETECPYSNDLSHLIFLNVVFDLSQLEDGSHSFEILGNEATEVRVEVGTNVTVEDGCIQSYDTPFALIDVEEGVLTIQKSGDNYIITYSISYAIFTTIKEFTGSFEGKLGAMPPPA